MELNDVMRTTFAAHEFTDDDLPNAVLYDILDNARFAPSGGGASIYPFCHNILLGARNAGYGGALTTMLSSAEPEVQQFLRLESHEAVCAMLTLGKPPKQLTKLSRKPVEDFAFNERADGSPLTA
ncbi:MAG: nitroreductase [Acidimicrobiales bacterium]|jgi:nitroreductase